MYLNYWYFRISEKKKKTKKNIHNKPSNSRMCFTYLHSSKAKLPITSYRDTNRQTICKMVELEKNYT